MMKRYRVLLIAEAANPEWTSVPLVGWSHARALAEITDAHLVTQIRNREAIERTGWVEGNEFTAIDSEAVAMPLWRISSKLAGGDGRGWTTRMAIRTFGYYYFERQIWKQFKSALQRGEYDLVHRITPLSPTNPSPLAKRCKRLGIPFVIGPLNGGVPWPKGFDRERRQEKEWLSYVRSAYKLLPGYHATRRHASALIIGSKDTLKQLDSRYHDKAIYIPENAIDPQRFSGTTDQSLQKPLRLVFLGRLVPYKCADIALQASADLLRSGRAVFDIIGDGPEMENLEKLIEQLGIKDQVHMHGWIEHHRVQEQLRRANLLVFPSVREFGGGVVLEAMALGLVPIIVNYAGPAELVTEETGFTIPLGQRERITESLKLKLHELADAPEQLPEMGRNARDHVFKFFTWSAKARQVVEVYDWVLGNRAEKPEFDWSLSSVERVP